MTTSKLPARPSLESLRKQAKKLARDSASGDADAIARTRAQLPQVDTPLSQRNAQLVLAREYGFPGWQELVKEVEQRLGGLDWAISQARRRIHDNDIEGLRQLVTEYPDLLSWQAEKDDGGLLGMATGSYGDSFNPIAEKAFTRPASAEFLIDAGAIVSPAVLDGLIASRAKVLLDLFRLKGLLPHSLRFLAALGDVAAIRGLLDTNNDDLAAVNDAFMIACHFQHADVAARLLDRAIALDSDLARKIDGGPGRSAFVQFMITESETLAFTNANPSGPWQAFVMRRVVQAANDSDLTTFVSGLRSEPWMLSDACVQFQVGLIERAVLRDRPDFISSLLDLKPAMLRSQVPPPSQAIEFAFVYAKPQLLPILLRIWPLPDDLPHAAGIGNLARVKNWFDSAGKPSLGDIANHAPASSVHPREPERGEVGVQTVLDTALGWAVLNNQFEVADFLLQHGADINTKWSSHEPASILHELVWHKNYDAMQFLIDRGIDMTILDYRWDATAEGWARHAAHDEKMAQWLAEARHKQKQSLR